LAALIGLVQSAGAEAGHKSRAEGSDRSQKSQSSNRGERGERREAPRTQYERRDTRKPEVRKETRSDRDRRDVRVPERKVERKDERGDRPKKWDGGDRRTYRRDDHKGWGDDRRSHHWVDSRDWEKDRRFHSKWKGHGRHRLSHWSTCAVDRYRVVYKPRVVHYDLPRRVIYCHERPYYEYVNLGIYLPSFWLDVAIGDGLPRGYLYYDPYCDETFVTLAGYREHLHCHDHSPALDVVYVDDLCDDDSSWKFSFHFVDRD
jgi:hypothetical protein